MTARLGGTPDWPLRGGVVWPAAVVSLAALGAAAATISTLDHLLFRASGEVSTGLCAAVVETACAAAHESPAAELLGRPISLWGGALYVAIGALAVAAAAARRRAARSARPAARRSLLLWVPSGIAVAALGSVGYSAWLASLLLRAGEWCPICATLYAVNLGLLAVAVGWSWPGLRRPLPLGVLGGLALLGAVFVAGAVPASFAYGHALRAAATALPATAAPASPAPAAPSASALPSRVPRRGPATPRTTLVEFSDFACPYCAAMHETLESFLTTPEAVDVALRFVNVPLDAACNPYVRVDLHPGACLAARAGVCAAADGRFWPYAARLFADRERQSRPDLLAHARAVGLEAEAFDRCLDDPATAAAVAEDIEIAQGLGVTATPTLLAGGLRYEGAMPPEQLVAVAAARPACACDASADRCACDVERRVGCACRAHDIADDGGGEDGPAFGAESCH